MFLQIKKPVHKGWLPILVDLGTFQIDAWASDVLNDPIEELFEVLRLCYHDRSAECRVFFWEEPIAWLLDFKLIPGSEELLVQVLYSHDWNQSDEYVCLEERHEARPGSWLPSFSVRWAANRISRRTT